MAWWHPWQRTSEENPSLSDGSRPHGNAIESPRPLPHAGVPAWSTMEPPATAHRPMPTVVQSMMQRTLASHTGASQLLSTASPLGHEVRRDGGGLVTSLLRPITGVDPATTEFRAGSDLVLQRTTSAAAVKTSVSNPGLGVTTPPRVLAAVALSSTAAPGAPQSNAREQASEPIATRAYSSANASLISAPEVIPYRVMTASTNSLVSMPHSSLDDNLDDTASQRPVPTTILTVIGRFPETRTSPGGPLAPTTAPVAMPQRRPLAIELPSVAKISRGVSESATESSPVAETISPPASVMAPRIRTIGLGTPISRLPDTARAMTSDSGDFDDIGTPAETFGLLSPELTTPIIGTPAQTPALPLPNHTTSVGRAAEETPGLSSPELTTLVGGAPAATVGLSSAAPLRRSPELTTRTRRVPATTSGLSSVTPLRRSPELTTPSGRAPAEDLVERSTSERQVGLGVPDPAFPFATDLTLRSSVSGLGEVTTLSQPTSTGIEPMTGDATFTQRGDDSSLRASPTPLSMASPPAAMMGSREVKRSVADVAPTVLTVEPGARSVVALVRRSLSSNKPDGRPSRPATPSWAHRSSGDGGDSAQLVSVMASGWAGDTRGEMASDGPNAGGIAAGGGAVGGQGLHHQAHNHASIPELRLADRVGPTSSTTVLARTPASHVESDFGIRPNSEGTTEFAEFNPRPVNRVFDGGGTPSAATSATSATNSSTFDATGVQRQGDVTGSVPSPAGPGVGAADLDALAHSLYERIRTRMRRELLDDRERAGFLLDRMR